MHRFVLLIALAAMSVAEEASLIITNGRVWTGDPRQPWAEAVAISGERILEAGTAANIQKRAGKGTRVIDAKHGMVVPGFIDSHIHFLDGGFTLNAVQLRDAKTKAEFVKRIKEYAARIPAGQWITAGEWDHQNWGGELPTHEWIDGVTPHNPVWVSRLDGHMGLANSLALKAAGVTKATKDVPGGSIVRGSNGEPTGILKDNAMPLVERVQPASTAQQADAALDAAMKYVASAGVTAVDTMGTWEDIDTYRRARNAGRLATRIYAAVPLATWERLRDTVAKQGRGDDWLQIGGLKAFVDGSLGSHTAAFLEPFSDAPNDKGLLVNKSEDLYTWTRGAADAGLHVMVHAIGDRAIRMQLDVFERVQNEVPGNDRRFRIEHAQHIAPDDIARFGKLGVIASMQPYHAIDDGRWAEKVIGHERSKTTYAFKSLLSSGARLAFGSDWPVAPATPLEGIYAAVTRQTLDDKHPGGWIPEQKITVEQALHAYTTDAAYARFAEKDLGSIAAGKLADLVIIDRNLTRIEPFEIRNARVRMTIAGGRVIYENK
jgi:predicted amidohydrolase YtcJ